jgi:hypothetical protein
MHCTLTEVQKLFEQEFTHAQNKVRVTVLTVLAPPSVNQITEELEDVKFISVND